MAGSSSGSGWGKTTLCGRRGIRFFLLQPLGEGAQQEEDPSQKSKEKGKENPYGFPQVPVPGNRAYVHGLEYLISNRSRSVPERVYWSRMSLFRSPFRSVTRHEVLTVFPGGFILILQGFVLSIPF